MLRQIIKEEVSKVSLDELVKIARAAEKAAPEKAEYGLWQKAEKMTASQLRDAISRHRTAIAAWQPIYDSFDAYTDFEYFDKKAGPLYPGDVEVMIANHEDAIDEFKEFIKDAEAREADDAVIAAAGMKKLSVEDLSKIYRAAKSEYSSSYSMMSDDALSGANNMAKKFGIRGYVDAGWFPQMLSCIERHMTWDKVPSDAKEDMLIDANEDVAYEARKLMKNKRKR